MQNMYIGDIGDYGKYGLLRALFPSFNKLGIVWYLVPDEDHLNDGKHIDYLYKPKFKDCDSHLFSTLKDIISSGKRNISEIEQSDILPNQTAFYSDYLSYDGINANSPAGRQKRLILREEWLNKALKTVQNCDVIFLDPDNGLETPSVKKHNAKAPKYVYYDEVEKFLSVTDTLIVYHHLGRNGTHASQIQHRANKLRELAGCSHKVISLCFKRGNRRAYFVITKQDEVIDQINKFVNSNWKKCFELVVQNLDKLAKQYIAFEKSDISDFQRKARLLQSIWRTEQGYEIGEFRGKKRGNVIPMPWAKETLNNYLSDTIKEVVDKEVIHNSNKDKLYGQPRIFDNLLSSQPLCFNLFAELQQDLKLATKVFKQLCPHRVNKITSIEFEHSPGRKDITYTGDRSAFDVYVEFLNNSDDKGFIGIEVKYHENLKNRPAEMKDRYFEIASTMGCFKDTCLDVLQISPLEQIWRDHLLAGSLLYSPKDDFKDGFFVFLFPQNNLHCQEAVVQYKQCLTIDRSFQSWTLEKVVDAIKQNTGDSWINELDDRYLNFEKITED